MTRSTTILAVRRHGRVAMGGDGQVTIGQIVMKKNADKVRRMYKDRVLAGFAGSAADALALFGKFEGKLEEYHGNLARAAVELAKEWRTDRVLRRLEALLAVADRDHSFIVSGSGDLIEPDDGVIGIGSGGAYAVAAARALIARTEMGAEEIVREAMAIAASLCIYTNEIVHIEVL